MTFKFTAAKEALSCSLSTLLPFSEPHTPQQPELNSDPLVKPTKSERNGITILHTEQQCLFLKLEIEAPCLSYPKTKTTTLLERKRRRIVGLTAAQLSSSKATSFAFPHPSMPQVPLIVQNMLILSQNAHIAPPRVKTTQLWG